VIATPLVYKSANRNLTRIFPLTPQSGGCGCTIPKLPALQPVMREVQAKAMRVVIQTRADQSGNTAMRKLRKSRSAALFSLSDMLTRDLANGLISPAQARETRKQQKEFERHRATIERRFSGLYVAYAGGNRYVGNSVVEVISHVHAVDATLLFYIEQIP
jgi:hypothetical protein